MTDKEKIIYLLDDALSVYRFDAWENSDKIASHLISHGVSIRTTGKWNVIIDDYDCEFMKCSCCKGEFYNADEDTIDRLYNYCPNCGAKMINEE